MAKARKVFICRDCGSTHSRWMGKCPDCGQWDTLEEETLDQGPASQLGVAAVPFAQAATLVEDGVPDAVQARPATAQPMSQISGPEPVRRIASGIGELDRVLGGGVVPGSAILAGGEPGIGKSTLLLQAARAWAKAGSRVLYVSSEESAEQVGMRAARIADGPSDGKAEQELYLLAETNLARIVEQAKRTNPRIMIIDSVQMIYKADLPASPGSVTQLRRCCSELVYLAKLSGVAIVLVGHVTKEGQLAGPRLLEHLVDAVLRFEGDRYHAHRIVRAVKNRFGTTLEIGIFEMTGEGLREVRDGVGVAAVLASGVRTPGSVVCPVMTGSRCVMVEVQALTATGFLGAAKRKSSGLDPNRLAMLIAVLEAHAGLRLCDRDIFASSVGGLRIAEPASDLALLLAIAGAHSRKCIPPTTAVAGEVGLGGEIRPVPQFESRLREAARLGCTRVLAPKANVGGVKVKGVEVVGVATIGQAIEHLD